MSRYFHLRDVTVAALLVVAALATTRAEAQAFQNFTLTNRTPHELIALHVSPTRAALWGGDVLGVDVLPSGGSVDIVFPPKGNACLYDLKAIYSSGEQAEWAGFDLCVISRISLVHNEATGETWAIPE